MKNTDWLSTLEVGDVVVVGARSGWGNPTLGKVARLTKTQVVVGASRFRRKDGRVIGADVFSVYYLGEATEEKVTAIRLANRKAKAINLLKNTDWREYEASTLEEIVAILQK
jgi:hypothetical protein